LNKVPANAVQGVVLVVDDDLSTRRALRVTLSELGFTVVEAGRGEEALSLVRLTWFDAVLLDVICQEWEAWKLAEPFVARLHVCLS
jgi:DNA-binding response OmpR family regulator